MYMYIYIHRYIYICIYVYIYSCLYAHAHTHTHIYIYTSNALSQLQQIHTNDPARARQLGDFSHRLGAAVVTSPHC